MTAVWRFDGWWQICIVSTYKYVWDVFEQILQILSYTIFLCTTKFISSHPTTSHLVSSLLIFKIPFRLIPSYSAKFTLITSHLVSSYLTKSHLISCKMSHLNLISQDLTFHLISSCCSKGTINSFKAAVLILTLQVTSHDDITPYIKDVWTPELRNLPANKMWDAKTILLWCFLFKMYVFTP